MAERVPCTICCRDKATEADWERPEMETNDPCEELDSLCWEPGEGGCFMAAEEAGRPTNIEDALAQRDKAIAERDELVRELRELVVRGRMVTDGLAVAHMFRPEQPAANLIEMVKNDEAVLSALLDRADAALDSLRGEGGEDG